MKKNLLLLIFSGIASLLLVACGSYHDGLNSDPYYDLNTGNESYAHDEEDSFKDVLTTPISTFSVDVDTASYSNMRRFINQGSLPPSDSVRAEEFVNYFTYDYNEPTDDTPFSVSTEVADCPWNSNRKLVMIGLQGDKMEMDEIPTNNLVFLIDVSGSMSGHNKLDLVKSSLKLLVDNLRQDDQVSIVVYSGEVGVKLQPTSGANKQEINSVIDSLVANGSTAGGRAIEIAYDLAKDNYLQEGNNRVIMLTDGDFNVGATSDAELTTLIENKRDEGIYLSILGYGMGNYKDSKMELLSNKGNGNYAYIDGLLEAQKVLVDEIGSTLLTIAKDVKIQVEFNPALIKGYRLIGYENRVLNNEDFEDDEIDAGDIGAGHSVTAFYEVILTSSNEVIEGIDDVKYTEQSFTDFDTLLTVDLRYKEPDGDQSQLITQNTLISEMTSQPTNNFLFASAVAEYSLLLKDSKYKSNATYEAVIARAKLSKGEDPFGYRTEFIRLVELAKALSQ